MNNENVQIKNKYNILKYSEENNKVISIYTTLEDSEKFKCGIVNKLLSKEVIFNHILPNGQYDGYEVFEFSRISKVEKDTKYNRKIEVLKNIYKVEFNDIEVIYDNGFLSLLQYAKNNNKIVSIEILNSGKIDAIGYIANIDEEHCTLRSIDDYGNDDGIVSFEIVDITDLYCDTSDEVLLELLNDSNK
jgi:hypothetical protein